MHAGAVNWYRTTTLHVHARTYNTTRMPHMVVCTSIGISVTTMHIMQSCITLINRAYYAVMYRTTTISSSCQL